MYDAMETLGVTITPKSKETCTRIELPPPPTTIANGAVDNVSSLTVAAGAPTQIVCEPAIVARIAVSKPSRHVFTEDDRLPPMLDVPEVVRCVLLCMFEDVEGGLCWLEVLEVPDVMGSVPLCMLEAVDGRLCLPEVPEVMRCVLLCTLKTV